MLAFHNNLLQSGYCQLSPSPPWPVTGLHPALMLQTDEVSPEISSAFICRTY